MSLTTRAEGTNQRQTKNRPDGDAFRPPPPLAHESAHPVGQSYEHDSSWGNLNLSTKRLNAGRTMLARERIMLAREDEEFCYQDGKGGCGHDLDRGAH